VTYIYNPQQLEPAENTFITALAFASSTGILTATRNDGVQLNTTSLDDRYVQENTHTTSATFNTSDGVLTLNQTDPTGTVTVDLDGRFPTENTHLNSATLGVDNVLSLGMVNPTSTITVDLSSLSDLNTHLDSASFNPTTKVLSLIMVNPSSTITVDLSGIEDTNTFVTSANFVDGTLNLNRNDGATVSVDLDGRYATQNTHLNSAAFNSENRELRLGMVNPASEFVVEIPGGPDENTFITELGFNADTGDITATRNDAVTVTANLNGRYVTENTHLQSANFVTDTGTLNLVMTDPASTISVDISGVTGENTHLDSASFNPSTKILSLIMVNPSSTITVDLSGIEDTNTFVTSANFVDGTLNLNRNDGATVSVDLDGRYSRINTHLNAASFDTGTRDLTLTTTDPEVDYVVNIPISPDENTFLTSLAFNTNSGELIATLNNDETVTVDLDGRFNLISNNTHVSAGSFDPNTGNITLTLVNPSSTITIPISDVSGQNTHLDSASLDDQTLNLNMINPESTIDVDLGELVDGKYLPINFDEEQADFQTLLEPGVYAASASGIGAPSGLVGAQNYISVYSQKDGDDVISATQIWTTGTNTFNRNIDPPRLWMRTYDTSAGYSFFSPWKEITTGGINAFLETDFGEEYRDFNNSRYRKSGYYRVDNIQNWDNKPSTIPSSSLSNILNTVMNPTSTLYPDRGYGFQELHSVDADSPTFHLRKWRRTFQSTNPDNIIYTDWFEYNIQGQRVHTEALDIFKVTSNISMIDVAGKRVIDVGIGQSFSISRFNNGIQGQRLDVIKTNFSGLVTILNAAEHNGGNIRTPTGGNSHTILRYYRGASFIYQNGYWWPLFSNSTS
jgi:hypothetical protein